MSLASWVTRNDPDRAKAEHKLDHLPLSPTLHGKSVPFPFADKNDYKNQFSNKEINSAIESAPVVDVPLHGLHAIQHSVKQGRVTEYLHYDPEKIIPAGTRSAKHSGLVDHPIVIQYKGKRYIHDGHHRLTAEKLAGCKSAKARLVNLDSVKKV